MAAGGNMMVQGVRQASPYGNQPRPMGPGGVS